MKTEELRVMVIGAHPDDPDLNAGCTVMKLIDAGALAASFMGGCRSFASRNMPPCRIGANGKANFCDQAYCKTMFISV